MTDRCNKLQHMIPEFVKLDSKGKGLEAQVMKEVKLPFAEQTHEVCWEPHTESLFVTQMTNSTLVKLTVDKNGILKDEQEQWTVGPENSGCSLTERRGKWSRSKSHGRQIRPRSRNTPVPASQRHLTAPSGWCNSKPWARW